jgi:hypothetical protein
LPPLASDSANTDFEKSALPGVDLLSTRGTKSPSSGSVATEMGIRQDSLDKRLGAIREKLGLENHHQLLSASAALRNPWSRGMASES